MFTDKRHSGGGVVSAVLGASGLAVLVYDIVRVYLAGGEVGAAQTISAALAAVYGAAGLLLGSLMYLRRDSFPFFPVLGITLNAALLALLAGLVVWGALA